MVIVHLAATFLQFGESNHKAICKNKPNVMYELGDRTNTL